MSYSSPKIPRKADNKNNSAIVIAQVPKSSQAHSKKKKLVTSEKEAEPNDQILNRKTASNSNLFNFLILLLLKPFIFTEGLALGQPVVSTPSFTNLTNSSLTQGEKL
jgi:hypothetical protein